MVETRASELQAVLEERDNLREELRVFREQQARREEDSHLEEVTEANEDEEETRGVRVPPPPPRRARQEERASTMGSIGSQAKEYIEITTDDPDQGVDQIPPGNAYARLFQRVEGLQEELRKQNKGRSSIVSQDLERLGKRPLANSCYTYAFPTNFHMPKFHEYDGTSDPIQHLNHFKQKLATWEGPEFDGIWCRLFPGSLTSNATDWYLSLDTGSISSFAQLSAAFMTHYIHQRREEADISSLFDMHQGKDENLQTFVTRFKNEVIRTNGGVTDKTAVVAFQKGVREKTQAYNAVNNPSINSLEELFAKTEKYIRLERLAARTTGKSPMVTVNTVKGEDRKDLELTRPPSPRREAGVHSNRDGGKGADNRRKYERDEPRKSPPGRRTPSKKLPPFNKTLEQIYRRIRGLNCFRGPPTKCSTIRGKPYCDYHETYNHSTSDCYAFQELLWDLLERGFLREFETGHNAVVVAPRAPPAQGFVNMILEGLRESNHQAKKKIRRVRQIQEERESVEIAVPVIRNGLRVHQDEPMGFTTQDLIGVMLPHNDPLVISVSIGNWTVSRVLVDCGSDMDILFTRGLDQMKLDRTCLQQSVGPVYGFSGGSIQPVGEIVLPVTAAVKTVMSRFVVVDAPTEYNVILGREWIHLMEAVPSSYYQKIRFPTNEGQYEIRSNQATAKSLRSATVRFMTHGTPGGVQVPNTQ